MYRLKFFIVLFFSTLGFSLSSSAEELRVFNWSDYIGETTIEDFEKETGIKVVYDLYDSIETLESRILAGSSGYDLVFASAQSVDRFIQAGLLAPLDKSSLSNFGNINPSINDRLASYDPDTKHSVPYMWGTIGMGYNVDLVKDVYPDADMSDLSTFFDPKKAAKLAKCGLVSLDSPTEVLGIALAYLGYEPDTGNADEINEARDLMLGVRPHIRYFSNVKHIDDLATGEICAALSYNGDAAIAAIAAEEANNSVNLVYEIPQQRTLIWIDAFTILKDAPNPSAAYKFLDYMMRPQVAADATNYLWYPTANEAAFDLIDEEITGDSNIYPSQSVIDGLFPDTVLPNKSMRLRTRAWTKITTGN